MAGSYALAGTESSGRTGGSKPHRAFPGICTLASGNLLRVYRRGTSHSSGDADLCCEISTDSGATWGSESVIRAYASGFVGGSPGGSASNQEGCPVVLQHGANAGKVLITGWQNNGWGYGSGATFKAVAYLSTDATATAWNGPYQIDNGFYNNGADYAYISSAAVELDDGTLLVAMSGYEQALTAGNQLAWSVRLCRSTDSGLTWTNHALVAASDGGANTTGYGHDEPFMIRLSDGTLLMSIRTNQTSGSPTHCYIWRGSADGLTWTKQGKAFTDMGSASSASRAGMIQDPATDVILIQHRINLPTSGTSVQGCWRWSADYGVTWTAGKDLHTGSAASYTTSTGAVYDYGMFTVLADGSIGMLWAEESDPNALLYFRRLTASWFTTPAAGYGNTVSSGYGSAAAESAAGSLLVLPSSSAWEQVGTSIFVRTVNEPSSVEATVTGTAGGLLRFAGADAARFDASLDGITWASAVDVPAGTSTVHLRVTPVAPGTTLSAEVGVPV